MRLQRISLRNYRGVAAADVAIAHNGVTIIQGPNEIGKSSLAEAIQFLFEEPDSSNKKQLKAIKSVNVDAGPSAEVELTTGAYHVVYFKRWHVGAKTELQILAPAPENLTGRPAHDRMKAILAETLDEPLWRALHYQQGVSITQAIVGESRTLASALDQAATGGARGGEEDVDLWQRVEVERARYFTSTGRDTSDRTRIAEHVTQLQARGSELRAELARLDASADRYQQLGTELAKNAAEEADQIALVKRQSADWDEVSAKKLEVERLALVAQAAGALAREAVAASERRQQFVVAAAAASAQLKGLEGEAEREAPALEAARTAQGEVLRQREVARGARHAAEEKSQRASEDFEHFREVTDCQLLLERRTRVEEAEAKGSRAAALLDECLVDEAKLGEIESASLAAAEARARLTGQVPTIRVEALKRLEVRLGDQRSDLGAGESIETAVTGDVLLTVGDVARVAITGGAGGRAVQEASDAAEEQLAELYRSVAITGGDPLAQARNIVRQQRDAQAEAKQAHEALDQNLRDLTPQLLIDKIERVEASIAAYDSKRDPAMSAPADLADAKPVSEAAAAAVDEVRRLEAELQEKSEQAEAVLAGVQEAANLRAAHGQMARQTTAATEQDLEAARRKISDAELDHNRREREQDAANVEAVHTQRASELAGDDPDSVASLLQNGQEVLDRLRRDHTTLELDLARIKSELEVRGETGLHDQLATVKSELAEREREATLTDRRAAAADLLYTRLGANRDAAKRSYVAPFRQQLEAFARIVFGPSVSVEVDHTTLQVTSRTLGGVTVPYDSLSAGAKEQLCVLARLACAALVSPASADEPDGGVPLVFDDALGYSDARRLERIGAAFNAAGQHSQVIILTCVPERYRNIGSATLIRLEAKTLTLAAA